MINAIPATSTVQIGDGTTASKALLANVSLTNACKIDIQANGELELASATGAVDASNATITALSNGAKVTLTQATNNIVLSEAQARALYLTAGSKTVYADATGVSPNDLTINATTYNHTYTWNGTYFAF